MVRYIVLIVAAAVAVSAEMATNGAPRQATIDSFPMKLKAIERAEYDGQSSTYNQIISSLREEVPVLLRELKDHSSPIRKEVITLLGDLKTKSAIPDIREALTDQDRKVRMAALWALGEMNDTESIPKIIETIHTKDRGIGFYGAQTLLRLGDKTNSVPKLIEILREEKVQVTDQGISGLVVLGNERTTIIPCYSIMIGKVLGSLDPVDNARGADYLLWEEWWKINKDRGITNEVKQMRCFRYLPSSRVQ